MPAETERRYLGRRCPGSYGVIARGIDRKKSKKSGVRRTCESYCEAREIQMANEFKKDEEWSAGEVLEA